MTEEHSESILMPSDDSSHEVIHDVANDVSNQVSSIKKPPSTGPRTARGKRISSRNALKHGFFSRELVLRHLLNKEDQKDFVQVLKGLRDDWKPVGQSELIQVELMANHLQQYKCILRFRRALRGNASTTSDPIANALSRSVEIDAKVCEEWRLELPPLIDLEKFQRCENQCLRNYYRAMSELERLQRIRLGQQVLPRLTVDLNE